MLDLRDPDAVILRLKEVRQLFADEGPLVPDAFSGFSAAGRERLPPGVAEFVGELADAFADSGPTEIGLSAFDWVVTRKLTKAAAARLEEGQSASTYGKAKQAVVVVYGMFESIRRRGEGRPNVWDRMSTFTDAERPGLEEAAAELAPARADPPDRLTYP